MTFKEEVKDGKVLYSDERFDFINEEGACLVDKSRHYGLTVREVKPTLEEEYHLGGNGQGSQTYLFQGNKVDVPGDPLSWLPHLWSTLISENEITSVLDVGSGIGYSSKWFSDQGMKTTAIEGLPYNVKNAVYPTIQHDLSKSAYLANNIDMVWCCEVAEHVDESAMEYFLDTVTNCRLLAITAAPPGDGGHHHVNCQPIEYWIKKIAERGMILSVDKTNQAREMSLAIGPRTDSHFQRNGLIFCR